MFENRESPQFSVRLFVSLVALCAAVTVTLPACATSDTADPVVIAPLGSARSVRTSGMTREELEDNVRRFADRYFTRISLATNTISEASDEQRKLMHDWKTVSQTAIVDVAIGPNAVTNLLDMMVMTRLSRLMVESYWIPEVLGEELGAEFLQTSVDLEEDIWSVADDVLTTKHQEDLRALVDTWHAENPEQIYPWYVRLSDFSGQRAASLAAVQQSGGLLKEVARAREAAEEIQAFGERVLFYLQRAPMITSNEFESGVSDVLKNPEIAALLHDTDRFVTSVDRLVELIAQLQNERVTAIDQLMDRVGAERRALLQDITAAEPGLRAALVDLQPVLKSIEQIVTLSNEQDPNSRPFDINEYRALVAEAAVTAGELRLLVQSVTEILGEESDAGPFLDALVDAERAVVRQAFWYVVALILIFFATLLVYRLIARRLLS